MKKNHLMMAFVAIIALFSASCNESYSELDRIEPTPTPTPSPTPQPDPDPDNTWYWNSIVDQTVTFDDQTEMVTAANIAQLSKQSGETKLDSATLRYQFGVDVDAPTRIVTESKDTTVYSGKGTERRTYGEFYRQETDSLRTVTTVVEGGFRTQYYNVSLTTNRTEGYSLHAGKWVPYKNVTETSVLSSLWHEPITEIVLNDSVFNRETVHNVLTITLTSDKGQKWYVSREKVVIVDHFVKVKEGKKEEEHNHPAWWGEPIKIIGEGTFIYQPGVGPEGQGVFYKNINVLFENVVVCMRTSSASSLDFSYTDADVYPIGSTLRGKTITKDNVTDLNSMIWRDGKWEPAACTYDHSNYCWSYMSPDGHDQGMTEHLAETCGLQNFAGKHTARLHPSLFYKGEMSNGTLTIKDDNGVAFMSFH